MISSIIEGAEIQETLAPKSIPLTWGIVAFAIHIVLLVAPGIVYGARLVARLDSLERNGSTMVQTHIQTSREADSMRDSRLASIEKANELRGAQLDRIETDVKELLKRVR